MLRDEILNTLKAHLAELTADGVCAIFLFGSIARGEDRPDSDVDLLVELDPERNIGIFAFLSLKQRLEDILGRPVDLVTPDALKRQLKDRILAEALRAA